MDLSGQTFTRLDFSNVYDPDRKLFTLYLPKKHIHLLGWMDTTGLQDTERRTFVAYFELVPNHPFTVNRFLKERSNTGCLA